MSAIFCLLASKARVVIFCTGLSQVTRVGFVSVTGSWKSSHLSIITTLLPEREKKFKAQPSAGICVFIFFWATEAYSQGVQGQGMRAIRG